jgi:16S rRNA G527 N7-methylase RsmG
MHESLRVLLEKELQNTVYYDKIPALAAYYELILTESLRQNLTKILSVEEFFYRHVYDCLELLKTNWLEYPVLDIGSGVGVPGLMTALLSGRVTGEWLLSESEKKKQIF